MNVPHTLVACAALGYLSVGCHRGPDPAEVTVGQLAELLRSDRPPVVLDANGEETRKEYGVIPGARLLPNSSSYPLDLLPEDTATPLVFYCASSWCGAADGAARRAMEAGYTRVSVLPEGIKGWANAGLETITGSAAH